MVFIGCTRRCVIRTYFIIKRHPRFITGANGLLYCLSENYFVTLVFIVCEYSSTIYCVWTDIVVVAIYYGREWTRRFSCARGARVSKPNCLMSCFVVTDCVVLVMFYGRVRTRRFVRARGARVNRLI